MIVISNPISVTNEINTIHSLFEEGMLLFHVRKPSFGDCEMKHFLLGINHHYRERLILHSHHHLAEELGIKRFHFSESERKAALMLQNRVTFDTYKSKGFLLSTSIHTIEDFNTLDDHFDYAFFSPVFPSISKENYASKTDLFEEIKKRENFRTQLVALGGMDSNTINQTLENGFDRVAVLGIIWNRNNPIENFKLCQRIVQSF
ncbi:thiamine phosphate synthase [Flavobacterium sp. ZT3R18]|uniref:thiamine phosphate synthase n=1 Tax=Flavobacterium sp. ZT3R18 TaxID=2594429 RepID=UPI00117993A6|nr:thiamine phosphate synthase [Flavobacterium sp. ZT3R18]TRX38581.1 thiamine phosphate synthase [Flavobacterium sp. ZT3R18]